MSSEPSTPLMRQYHGIKQQVPNTLLMFRLGDFYELFYDDGRHRRPRARNHPHRAQQRKRPADSDARRPVSRLRKLHRAPDPEELSRRHLRPDGASAYKGAAEMNARLSTQGASLNADNAAAVSRFQLLFGLAAGSMLDHRWDEVLEHLQAVEAETAKVAKVVGR